MSESSDSNVMQGVPFFRVSDMQRSLSFYVDGVGCTMTKKWIDGGKLRWCWLELGSASIMLQQFPTEGHDAWKPSGAVGLGVSISFQCRDALSLYREFVSRGVQAKRPFVGNHMWVTSIADPDGYVLEFESVTNDSEDSDYID